MSRNDDGGRCAPAAGRCTVGGRARSGFYFRVEIRDLQNIEDVLFQG